MCWNSWGFLIQSRFNHKSQQCQGRVPLKSRERQTVGKTLRFERPAELVVRRRFRTRCELQPQHLKRRVSSPCLPYLPVFSSLQLFSALTSSYLSLSMSSMPWLTFPLLDVRFSFLRSVVPKATQAMENALTHSRQIHGICSFFWDWIDIISNLYVKPTHWLAEIGFD